MDANGQSTAPKVLWGAKAIAEVLGVSRPAANRMLEAKRIPAKKIGSRWVADRDRLLAFIADEQS